jgi:hypothetical protein
MPARSTSGLRYRQTCSGGESGSTFGSASSEPFVADISDAADHEQSLRRTGQNPTCRHRQSRQCFRAEGRYPQTAEQALVPGAFFHGVDGPCPIVAVASSSRLVYVLGCGVPAIIRKTRQLMKSRGKPGDAIDRRNRDVNSIRNLATWL